MKRALFLLPVPLVAVVVASLMHSPEKADAPRPTAAQSPSPRLESTASTWVATTTLPHPPRAALAVALAKQGGPKPPTDSRTALMDSHPPIVAPLSIDQLGSPRERLFAATHGASEARQIELGRLSERASAHLDHLREERAHATGEERVHLDQTIAKFERNQSYRSRVVKATVHAPARPGTSMIGMNLAAPSNKPAASP